MINIQKGITLFLRDELQSLTQLLPIYKLVGFLSQEFNFININIDLGYGIHSSSRQCGHNFYTSLFLVRTINTDIENISKTIDENSFRLEGIYLYIPNNIKCYKTVFNQLKKYENLIIFVIVPERFRSDVISNNIKVFRDIYEIIKNPDWIPTSFPDRSDSDLGNPKFLFANILTNDQFSLDSFKQTYIRDKKLNIFLDSFDDM